MQISYWVDKSMNKYVKGSAQWIYSKYLYALRM